MLKKSKRIFSFLLALVMMAVMAVPAMAAEPISEVASSESKMKLVVITPEEMDTLIANHEAGIVTYNWFDDYVALTITNEGSCCKVVLMNLGFPFDRCDVNGSVSLYDTSMTVVGHANIAERKLLYGVARVTNIYPIGKKYTSGSYSLRVSDGDVGTLYEDTFEA